MVYDIIIIGAGPGGYETAVEAAKRGLQVLIVEAGPVGGTCLNEGCIPTKTLCRTAELYDDIKVAGDFGINLNNSDGKDPINNSLKISLDFGRVIARKDEVVQQLRSGVEMLLKHKNITLVRGYAKLLDTHNINVTPILENPNSENAQDGSNSNNNLESIDYQGNNIIVSTGSISASLPVPGADLPSVINSGQLLQIDHVPERLCIIGAGVIGLEFASIFHSFGSEVTVVEYCKEVLPRFDTDLAKRLRKSLSSRGINIITQAQVTSISDISGNSDSSDNSDSSKLQSESISSLEGKNQVKVSYLHKGAEESVVADKVLMAVGRRANLGSLNFEEVGIELDRRGVVVNENLQTSVPNIYAIGDINGGMMLAHAAKYQGLKVLDYIMGIESKINLDIMPAAVFTNPEVAVVGLTEEDCKAQDVEYKALKSFYRANGKSLAMGSTEGYCKLLVTKDDDPKVLGAHIMGAHAADLIQEVSVLMREGGSLESLRTTVHPHPTLSEIVQDAAHSL